MLTIIVKLLWLRDKMIRRCGVLFVDYVSKSTSADPAGGEGPPRGPLGGLARSVSDGR